MSPAVIAGADWLAVVLVCSCVVSWLNSADRLSMFAFSHVRPLNSYRDLDAPKEMDEF